MYEVERKIVVEWVRTTDDTFAVRLTAYADDRPGILSHLTSVVFHEGSNIKALEAQPDEQRGDGSAIITMLLDVKDKKQLERVVAAVRRISGVRDVERVN
jgi:GTP pyrophosphokinase